MEYSSDASLPRPPLDDLVGALIDVGGSLSQIVDHMTRSARAPGASEVPVPDVLASVLRDTLGTVQDRHGEATVAAASRVVADAATVIAEEIFLVPLAGSRRHRVKPAAKQTTAALDPCHARRAGRPAKSPIMWSRDASAATSSS